MNPVKQDRRVTVFGGSGFLGRRAVHHLLEHGFAVRAATRHPQESDRLFGATVESVSCDVDDDQQVAAAVAGAYGVVNAVSLYVESGSRTFRSVHVEAAARIARLAAEARVERLVLVSGIGSDPSSESPYIRSRGLGEKAVRTVFPAATIVRPAVMFGPGDYLVAPLGGMLRRMPVFPLFGAGETRLQPAYVEDVAEAIARILASADIRPLYEFGGPAVFRFRELVETIARHVGSRARLVSIPFGLWHAGAAVAEFLPKPPITRNQVELMRLDNVAGAEPGFTEHGIEPRALGALLPTILPQA